MNRYKKNTRDILFCLFILSVILAKIVIAQEFKDYYPLHVGDYWIQHADSLEGKPGTSRMDVEAVDNIGGKDYFRMKQQLTEDGTGKEYAKWYVWLREDSSGILLGAFGDTSLIIELHIPTANIIVDGNPSDWTGITPFVTDPQGDDSPVVSGDDIRAIYVAQDANHLFIRMELWENANTNFQNGPVPYNGKYLITVDNNGPYNYMNLGIAYDPNLSQWSLGYNYSSSEVPPGLEGPYYVGVNGTTIEIKLPFYLIENPSRYYKVSGEVSNYTYQSGSVLDELFGKATVVHNPPIQWLVHDMATPGFKWEFDAPDMGGHFINEITSVSETVEVPAGIFNDCIKFQQIIIDASGDTTQNVDTYYAKGVGEVFKIGWSNWMKNMKFELTEYSVQSILIDVTDSVQAGHDLNLSISSGQPNFQPTTKTLYYRNAGEQSWNSLNISTTGANFDVTIPQQAVTLRGIEYYVYLSDGFQEMTYPTLDPATKPAVIQVRVKNYTPNLSLPRVTYQMISVPLELADPRISSVLRDDYGEYDRTRWRLFRWENGDYVEYPNIRTNFTPGTSFWLVTYDGQSFDVDNGRSVDSSRPYSVTLQPGWNQVANPFAFPIEPDTVNVPQGALEPPVYYDGNEYQYDMTLIQPWQGCFVFNKTIAPVTILISPIAAGNLLPKSGSRLEIDTENEYLVQLSARMPGTKLIDTQNYIGFRTLADNGRDAFDFAEAPPIGEYIQLSIIENEERFAGNFKTMQGNGHDWELDISTTLPFARPVEVSLHETGQIPDGCQIYVLDQDYNCSLPIEAHTFQVDFSKEFPVRHLKIMIGSAEYARNNNDGIPLTPFEYRLEQNFPNPFNSATTIRYQLARRSHVDLEIYNILGQKIRSVVNAVQNTGQHVVAWNGMDDAGNAVASGIYIYSLKTSKFSATRKLILIE